jgi:hypothetical protein
MAQYRDPYTDHQQYAEGPSYNPYDRQPHQAYDQGGYDPHTTGGYRDDLNGNPQDTGAPYAPEMQEANPHYNPNFAKEATQLVVGALAEFLKNLIAFHKPTPRFQELEIWASWWPVDEGERVTCLVGDSLEV